MSVFRSRPALRWLVPSAAAVVIIGGGATAGTIVASADSSLPDRSAAQLLVDVQNAKVDGFSGTVVETADLGLPSALAGAASSVGGEAGTLANLVAGSNTARVWYAGKDQSRLSLVGSNGETDMIHNGTDVWLWQSKDNSGMHLKVSADQAAHPQAPAGLPSTPQEAADQALAAIDPTTKVTTTGTAKVAGRDAYELVLSPKDTASLVGQVRLAIDSQTHIPLRVDVYAKNATTPAVRVAFQQISFTKPDAQQFAFTPPPGAKITEATPQQLQQEHQKVERQKAKSPLAKSPLAKSPLATAPKVIGQGWTSIVELQLPATPPAKNSSDKAGSKTPDPAMIQQGLDMLTTPVSGAWGKGHVLTSSLFSALITDDNRVLIGAVTPAALEAAAGK